MQTVSCDRGFINNLIAPHRTSNRQIAKLAELPHIQCNLE
jgi:hypothetical protein